MTTKTAITPAWTQVAADISALSIIQAVAPAYAKVELAAGASAPAASAVGIRILAGDTVPDSSIDAIGTSGKLYARALSGSNVSIIVN